MTGGGPDKRSSTVLIIDDDPSVRDNLALLVGGEGYPTLSVSNGVEALEKLRWGLRPCLILLDMRMSVMTGWEFRAAQKADPALADIPVVAVTAGKWKASDLADFEARLEKPIDPRRLQALLAQHCPPAAKSPAKRASS